MESGSRGDRSFLENSSPTRFADWTRSELRNMGPPLSLRQEDESGQDPTRPDPTRLATARGATGP